MQNQNFPFNDNNFGNQDNHNGSQNTQSGTYEYVFSNGNGFAPYQNAPTTQKKKKGSAPLALILSLCIVFSFIVPTNACST